MLTRGEDEHGALTDNSNSFTGRMTLFSKNWSKLGVGLVARAEL